MALVPVGEGMSLAEVGRRCGRSTATVMKWPGGIRVGGTIVKLECEVVGSRCLVTEEQLEKFKRDCHIAKFGEPPTETKSQADKRDREAIERFAAMVGKTVEELEAGAV
jgi:transposase